MTREERAETYHNQGFNCCQAVIAAFSDVTGLSEAQSLAVGSGNFGGFGGSSRGGGFGGGMRCGEVCGAVSGAVMVLSLTHPYNNSADLDSKNRIAHLTKEFHRRFRAQFSCERCLDLLKTDISTTEQFRAAKERGVMKKCAVYITAAVAIAEQMLEEEKNS